MMEREAGLKRNGGQRCARRNPASEAARKKRMKRNGIRNATWRWRGRLGRFCPKAAAVRDEGGTLYRDHGGYAPVKSERGTAKRNF